MSSVKRPASVTWLAVAVLMLATLNLTRFGAALHLWSFLESQPLTVSPLYLAASGLLWGLLALATALGLWLGRRWALLSVQIGVFAYVGYFWIDRLFIASDQLISSNRLFWMVGTVIVIGAVFLISLRPGARAYFGDPHDE